MSNKPPLRSYKAPLLLHVELTTRCPLHCPQCYCSQDSIKDISKDKLFGFLREAGELKIANIALSGGEPLTYPYLIEVMKYITEQGMRSIMATSGCGLTKEYLKDIQSAGIGSLWISLNGSSEEINQQSREGFREAIYALKLLQKTSLIYGINWVARQDNAYDFPNIVKLAKQYGVKYINILGLKPDSQMEVTSYVSGKALTALGDFIKSFQDPSVKISVERCFSDLRTYLYGNNYTGIDAGCGAGRYLMAIDVEGKLMPCRHLPYAEKQSNIRDYWFKSNRLYELRNIEENIKKPCSNSDYSRNCQTYRATGMKYYNDFYSGEKQCPIFKEFLDERVVRGD